MVCTRLRGNYNAHHRYAVHLHVTLYISRTKFGTSHIAEADNLAVNLLDDDIVELLGSMHQTQSTDSQLCSVSFYTSRRKLNILLVYSILYVDWGNSVSRHLYRIQPQAHRVFLLTPDAHTTHIGNGLKLLLNGKVCNLTQLKK